MTTNTITSDGTPEKFKALILSDVDRAENRGLSVVRVKVTRDGATRTAEITYLERPPCT